MVACNEEISFLFAIIWYNGKALPIYLLNNRHGWNTRVYICVCACVLFLHYKKPFVFLLALVFISFAKLLINWSSMENCISSWIVCPKPLGRCEQTNSPLPFSTCIVFVKGVHLFQALIRGTERKLPPYFKLRKWVLHQLEQSAFHKYV